MRNRFTFRALSLLCTLALLTGLLTAPASAADTPDAWAAGEVERAISLGLVPDDLQSDYTADITRAEFCRLAVAFLAKAAADNGLFLTPQTVSFDDTDDTDVLIAAGFGIVSGDGKGSFRPDDGITRQEAAVMLYNTLWALGMPSIGQGETFTDQASIASWASGAVSAIVDRGVMNGTGGGAFSPLDSYSRQQAYVTMYRLMSSLYLQLETKSYQLLVDETAQAACTLTNGASGASWSSSNPAVVAIASDTGSGTATLRHRDPDHHQHRHRLQGEDPHPLLQRRGLGSVPPDRERHRHPDLLPARVQRQRARRPGDL